MQSRLGRGRGGMPFPQENPGLSSFHGRRGLGAQRWIWLTRRPASGEFQSHRPRAPSLLPLLPEARLAGSSCHPLPWPGPWLRPGMGVRVGFWGSLLPQRPATPGHPVWLPNVFIYAAGGPTPGHTLDQCQLLPGVSHGALSLEGGASRGRGCREPLQPSLPGAGGRHTLPSPT